MSFYSGNHVPESVEYGVTSFVFRARRPFHPQRLHELVHSEQFTRTVVRSKGFSWLANHHMHTFIWGQAGKQFTINPADEWYCERMSNLCWEHIYVFLCMSECRPVFVHELMFVYLRRCSLHSLILHDSLYRRTQRMKRAGPRMIQSS